jgi:hypothetical protein
MNPNRFLNFGAASSGGNGASGNAAGGSGGGSGNFLFDIIRVSTAFNFIEINLFGNE